ncbi:uncharacterized protein LOC34620070 [Cyclospora cayetanensis]|uniref:Uncharacterized protein LOC34620070 n=1 Tax=Cyclospora cayetanensis TaxID=88456 RepID=A0A6P6RRD6_9EIME|nr:uncharacterized protein LOC34620070 [Cyclospora cayetanensis]
MTSSKALGDTDSAPCPLTEGEHCFYSQQPVCHVSHQLFSFDPAATLSIFYDPQHNRVLHQVENVLYAFDCAKVHPKLKDGYPIRFPKPKCMLISFSPCGNFLLYVTALAEGEDSGSAPRLSSQPSNSAADAAAASARPPCGITQEAGIVDFFGDDSLTTFVPLKGGTVCEDLPGVLQAFWLAVPLTASSEASTLLVVITQKNIELFRFVHAGKTLHALKKVAQVSLLAWIALPSWPKTAAAPIVSGDAAQQQQHQQSQQSAPAATLASTGTASSVVFVVAVGQRTLQPFLLDSKTLCVPGMTQSLVRLAKIELNLPLWQALQQRDVYVFSLYDTAYCVHADGHAGRISLRAITGPLQPDTVLDALAPGDLQLLALDNMIVVYHAALDSVLLFDVHRSPLYAANGMPEGASLETTRSPTGGPPQMRIKGKPVTPKPADLNKGVWAVGPLVRATALSMQPAAPFRGLGEKRGGAAEGQNENVAEASAPCDGLMDVELQAPNLEVAQFVSPDVIIDAEFGGVYRLELNTYAIMHRLLKEKQSLCAAVQVLQNRSHCKAEVLRLTLHALRLETSLVELQPLLFLLNSKYRSAIEQVPLSLLAYSQQQSSQECGAVNSATAGGSPCSAARAGHRVSASFPSAAEAITATAGITSGRATIPLELLLQSIGSQTVITERDVVFSVFYPFVRQQYNLPPNTLLLDASFPQLEDAETPDEARVLPTEVSDGSLARQSPRACLTLRKGRSSSSLPYILSVAAEYTRTLLMLQVFPHKVLQAFLFDCCAFFKRGDFLRQLLQYHLLLDSVDLLERLYVVWRQLAATTAAGDRSAARDERWLRQACLDAALRLRDWRTIVSILLACKQHKEIIPLLRQHGASDFPLKTILRSIAADVEAQKEQPGLLQHVLGHIRAWISECKAREAAGAPPCPPPNLQDCAAWLPGVEEKQQPAGQPSQDANEKRCGDTDAAALDPQLINAIGEVSNEFSEALPSEGEEKEAASGWAALQQAEAECCSSLSSPI